MSPVRNIAILGGGPAGAMLLTGDGVHCAAGFQVTIYDEHLAWEKPCGGGLTQKALAAFPFLLSSPAPKKPINNVELISSDGKRARLRLNGPIIIYARKSSEWTSSSIAPPKQDATSSAPASPRLETDLASRTLPEALPVVVAPKPISSVTSAAGARNSLLPATAPLPPEDLELTLGYYIPVESDLMKVKFVKGLEGYLWSFPRLGHLSVGICANMAKHASRELRKLLDSFVAEENLGLEGAELYSHILPSPRHKTLQQRSL